MSYKYLIDPLITRLKDKLVLEKRSFRSFHRDYIKSTGMLYPDFLRNLNQEESVTGKMLPGVEKYLSKT